MNQPFAASTVATEDPQGDWFQCASSSQQALLRKLDRIMVFDRLDLRENRESLFRCAEASFNEFEVAPGRYRVAIADLNLLDGYDSPQEKQRIQDLAEAIKESQEIEPVFVALDQEGFWLVEGQHRARAMLLLGYQDIPARLMVDLDDVPEAEIEASIQAEQERVERIEASKKAIDYLQGLDSVAAPKLK